jgi:hypothetical protein
MNILSPSILLSLFIGITIVIAFSSQGSIYNPSSSVLIFVIITLLIFIPLQYASCGDKLKKNIIFIIYLLSNIIIQFLVNLGITKTMCGSNQWGIALMTTLFPWMIIFGVLFMILLVFKGWLVPFSNTFGYGITKLLGSEQLLKDILKDKISEQSVGNSKELAKFISDSLSEPSLILNQFNSDYDKFNELWNIMKKGGLFKNSVTPDMKERLYRFVCLKDIISESMWYLLTGILTITASTNYIVSKGCNGDVKQMQERHADFERQLEKDGKINKKDEERIYYVTD